MKKVLFATSALVASAGFAAADVSLSGWAEMGITGGSGIDTTLHTDVDVSFTMSGTTDNGLTFGTSVDLDEAGNLTNTNAVAVFISGGFGTLTMGDTDNAFDWGMAEVPTGSGSITDSETGHSGYSGNGGIANGTVARYDHSIGGLGFAVSFQAGTGAADDIVGLGLRYSMGDLGIGLGYETQDARDIMGISVSYSMGNISLGANYSVDDDGTTETTHVGLGASYSMDAITVGVNWGETDDGAGADSGVGFSAGYDLGGGASIVAGVSNDSPSGAASTNVWSLGVSMSF